MSELSKLAGKPKKFKIGDIEISIKPLSVADMDIMMKLGKEETQTEATKELLDKVLKDSYPEATEEEINRIELKNFKKIMESIMEVNGMDKSDVDTKFLVKVKKKQQGTID